MAFIYSKKKRIALKVFLGVKYVFAVLPTAFGKSLIHAHPDGNLKDLRNISSDMPG